MCGTGKPHLPWRHPHKFWDLYEGKTITTAKHQSIGENITTLAFERNGGQGYSGTFGGKKCAPPIRPPVQPHPRCTCCASM